MSPGERSSTASIRVGRPLKPIIRHKCFIEISRPTGRESARGYGTPNDENDECWHATLFIDGGVSRVSSNGADRWWSSGQLVECQRRVIGLQFPLGLNDDGHPGSAWR